MRWGTGPTWPHPRAASGSSKPEDVDFPIINAFEKDTESFCSRNCFDSIKI